MNLRYIAIIEMKAGDEMKMKEVMDQTGLTRKTVLFYEEQGLLTPQITRMNGREYREYTDEHIDILRNIATLRKSGFSIDEIRRMQASDTEVFPIFMEYRQRLMEQKKELEQLCQTVTAIQPEALDTMQSLVGQIAAASAPLPLPACDCTPHFRYLDEEEAKLQPAPRENALHGDVQPLEIDQEHLFNTGQLGKKKALDDLKADLQEAPSRGVPNRPAGSCLLDIVEAIIVLALVLFAFDTITAFGTSGFLSGAVLLDLGIIAVLALLLVGIFLMRRRRSSKSIK